MADRGWMTKLASHQPLQHTYLGSISGELPSFLFLFGLASSMATGSPWPRRTLVHCGPDSLVWRLINRCCVWDLMLIARGRVPGIDNARAWPRKATSYRSITDRTHHGHHRVKYSVILFEGEVKYQEVHRHVWTNSATYNYALVAGARSQHR